MVLETIEADSKMHKKNMALTQKSRWWADLINAVTISCFCASVRAPSVSPPCCSLTVLPPPILPIVVDMVVDRVFQPELSLSVFTATLVSSTGVLPFNSMSA